MTQQVLTGWEGTQSEETELLIKIIRERMDSIQSEFDKKMNAQTVQLQKFVTTMLGDDAVTQTQIAAAANSNVVNSEKLEEVVTALKAITALLDGETLNGSYAPTTDSL